MCTAPVLAYVCIQTDMVDGPPCFLCFYMGTWKSRKGTVSLCFKPFHIDVERQGVQQHIGENEQKKVLASCKVRTSSELLIPRLQGRRSRRKGCSHLHHFASPCTRSEILPRLSTNTEETMRVRCERKGCWRTNTHGSLLHLKLLISVSMRSRRVRVESKVQQAAKTSEIKTVKWDNAIG